VSTREKARQNLQVAAVNAALEQQLLTLECAPVETAKFEFALAGLPVLVCLHDAGFDEVGFYVMVAATELGRKLHRRWRTLLASRTVCGLHILLVRAGNGKIPAEQRQDSIEESTAPPGTRMG
jgi:hypothetical protein